MERCPPNWETLQASQLTMSSKRIIYNLIVSIFRSLSVVGNGAIGDLHVKLYLCWKFCQGSNMQEKVSFAHLPDCRRDKTATKHSSLTATWKKNASSSWLASPVFFLLSLQFTQQKHKKWNLQWWNVGRRLWCCSKKKKILLTDYEAKTRRSKFIVVMCRIDDTGWSCVCRCWNVF